MRGQNTAQQLPCDPLRVRRMSYITHNTDVSLITPVSPSQLLTFTYFTPSPNLPPPIPLFTSRLPPRHPKYPLRNKYTGFVTPPISRAVPESASRIHSMAYMSLDHYSCLPRCPLLIFMLTFFPSLVLQSYIPIAASPV